MATEVAGAALRLRCIGVDAVEPTPPVWLLPPSFVTLADRLQLRRTTTTRFFFLRAPPSEAMLADPPVTADDDDGIGCTDSSGAGRALLW